VTAASPPTTRRRPPVEKSYTSVTGPRNLTARNHVAGARFQPPRPLGTPALAWLVSAAISIVAPAPLLAESTEAWAPAPVARIRVDNEPVFDEARLAPAAFLGRMGNTLHIDTRERVIRDLLTIRTGDTLDVVGAREAERILRRAGLFVDAAVRVSEREDSLVVHVVTRDAWSTNLQLTFSTAGGGTDVTVGGVETNFLGLGDEVAAIAWWTDDDSGQTLAFTRRRFLTPHGIGALVYSDGEESRYRRAVIRRPFYTTTATWSGSVHASDTRGNAWLYVDGDQSGRYHLRRDLVYGHYSRYLGGRDVRWRLGGVAYLDDTRSRPVDDTDPILVSGERLRNDRRRLRALAVGRRSRRFVSVRGIDRAGAVEDMALGLHLTLEAGAELEALGSSADRPYLSAGLVHSQAYGTRTFGSVALRAQGLLRDGETAERELAASWEGVAVRGPTVGVWRLAARLGADLPPEALLYLGARNGLRGFPYRAFRGTRAIVGNVEERIYPGWRLSILEVGVALFSDVGYVWGADDTIELADVRSSVGVGLRLRNPGLSPFPLRVDLGRGLGHDGDWQISVSTGEFLRVVRRLDYTAPVPAGFGGSIG